MAAQDVISVTFRLEIKTTIQNYQKYTTSTTNAYNPTTAPTPAETVIDADIPGYIVRDRVVSYRQHVSPNGVIDESLTDVQVMGVSPEVSNPILVVVSTLADFNTLMTT